MVRKSTSRTPSQRNLFQSVLACRARDSLPGRVGRVQGGEGKRERSSPAPENGTPHRLERKQKELTHTRANSQSPAQRKRPGRVRATLAPPVPAQLRTRPGAARRVATAPAAPLPQPLVLLRQPLALRLDELDVVDRACEHGRLARLRRAVQVAAFALR